MDQLDFYNDLKFCHHCDKYVRYLMSMEHSYCVECGQKVRLFSSSDWLAFNEAVASKRPKGGRPRKTRGAESA